jgi:quercetin dioxygenase-like cupin family protein
MTEHPEVIQVDVAGPELLATAHQHDSKRAARTLVTGPSQRATLIALVAGAELAEHDSPPAATLYVLTGQVRLHAKNRDLDLDAGQLAAIPPLRHSLIALVDAVVLLTVALR